MMLTKKGQFPSNWIKKGYVFVDPSDKNVYPPEFHTVDPSTFTPPSYKEVGPHRNWALEEPEVDTNGKAIDMMKKFMTKAAAFNLYLKYPSPFEQYVGAIAKRKIDALSSPEIQAALKTTLTIRMELTECGGDCYRIFTVPASTPLSVLHENILGPIMGWSSHRHGYVFQDPRDGAVLGPKKNSTAEFADMKHANLKFNAYMDDKNIPLAALLHNLGDYCWYVYDIGDHWEHGLKVVEVLEEGHPDHNQVRLLGGRGACPAEDSVGLEGKGCEPYAAFLRMYKTQPQLCKKTIKAGAAASNFVNKPFDYDPLIFHEGFHRAQLELHLSGNAHLALQQLSVKDAPSVGEGTKMMLPVNSLPVSSQPHCWHCGDEGKALMKCGKCNTATYCCRGCQVGNWKAHKVACGELCAQQLQAVGESSPQVEELLVVEAPADVNADIRS